MNWFRQLFCEHEIVSKETRVTRPTTCGGFVWSIEEVTTILHYKKCSYTKRVVV